VTRKGRNGRCDKERKKREDVIKREEEEDVTRKGRNGRCD
jgi:hypothetical protein